MRVIVTGGAGFVGSHVCVALAEAGHTPVIIDTFVNAKPDVPERIARITGTEPPTHEVDIRDAAGLDVVLDADHH
ncbi:MAG: NAD-dependent epimerase/dehydratase family protein, partial [Acidimicrobiia bacterium]